MGHISELSNYSKNKKERIPNSPNMHLVDYLERKKLQIFCRPRKFYTEDQNELLAFVLFWCKQSYVNDTEPVINLIDSL